LVVGPDVDAGRRIDEPIYLQDVMPTTLELAKVDKPEHVEFHSILPLLAGKDSPYESIYGCYLEKQRSIRTDRHKLIVYPEAPALRLYDVQADPLETNDLAGDPTNKPLVRELFEKLVNLQGEMNDDLNLAGLAP
jgi:choline-sulfatase